MFKEGQEVTILYLSGEDALYGWSVGDRAIVYCIGPEEGIIGVKKFEDGQLSNRVYFFMEDQLNIRIKLS